MRGLYEMREKKTAFCLGGCGVYISVTYNILK